MPSASSKHATGFGGWRKRRPFAAGLFMALSGVVMVTPAYLSFEVSNIIIQVSTISGVSTLLIGALLVTCAVMTWYKPEMRLLAGVASMILGIVALPMSNLGGFIIGTLLALIGGALALSWTPQDKVGDQPQGAAPEESADTPQQADSAGGNRGESRTAVLALLVALGTLTGTVAYPAPPAQAQIPLPQLPQLPALPGAPSQQQPQPPQPSPQQGDSTGPQVPGLPPLPAVPQLPALPSLQDLANSPQIPDDLRFDFSPPAPIPDELPVQDSMYEIRSDSTKLVGNVKFSLIQQPTTRGPEPALRIDADKAILDNLSVQFPGTPANNFVSRHQRSGPGQISTLTGNFHIIVRKLTVTPQVSGVATFPITLDASMAPIELQKELVKVGLGQPEALASQLVMLNGVMDTYFVKADQLDLGPGTVIGD